MLRSDVHLQHAVYALCVGDQAQELPAVCMPRVQRDGPAQPPPPLVPGQQGGGVVAD
jgi:hypothetical protein